MTDADLDARLTRARSPEPAPELTARIRGRLAKEPLPRPGLPWHWIAVPGLAGALLAIVLVTRMPSAPDTARVVAVSPAALPRPSAADAVPRPAPGFVATALRPGRRVATVQTPAPPSPFFAEADTQAFAWLVGLSAAGAMPPLDPAVDALQIDEMALDRLEVAPIDVAALLVADDTQGDPQ